MNSRALKIIQDLLTDYVNSLQKEHPTAARLVQANANMAIQELVAGSDRQVPDETGSDSVQGAGPGT